MRFFLSALVLLLATQCLIQSCAAAERETLDDLSPHHNPPNLAVVHDELWGQIDGSVQKSLDYLASQQNADGSIETVDSAKPAITSLAVMCFLSAGHQPGSGPYGEQINRAIDFVLSTQLENGLFSYLAPDSPASSWITNPAHLATYNQGICGLMLGEVYGTTDAERAARIKLAIEKGLLWTRGLQRQSSVRQSRRDKGGCVT